MESFIVRIYRREKEEIAGLVEVVEGGEKRSFTDVEGLLGILKIDVEDVKFKNPAAVVIAVNKGLIEIE